MEVANVHVGAISCRLCKRALLRRIGDEPVAALKAPVPAAGGWGEANWVSCIIYNLIHVARSGFVLLVLVAAWL